MVWLAVRTEWAARRPRAVIAVAVAVAPSLQSPRAARSHPPTPAPPLARKLGSAVGKARDDGPRQLGRLVGRARNATRAATAARRPHRPPHHPLLPPTPPTLPSA